MQTVHIPEASFYNPTKCLVLELDPAFIQSYYEEILFLDKKGELIFSEIPQKPIHHFCSNDKQFIDAFVRLYHQQLNDESPTKDLVDELIIKEMLLKLFPTEALLLLKQNFEKSLFDKKIQRSVAYIKENMGQRISVKTLAEVSGYGLTSFYKRFKDITGITPTDYILNERISQSKILMKKNRFSLKEIAYHCGFNSYEYFCSSFKKLENIRPSQFRKSNL